MITETYDFTEVPTNTDGFGVCPKCGRTGQIRYHFNLKKPYETLYLHKGHIEHGLFNIVDEECVVPLGQK